MVRLAELEGIFFVGKETIRNVIIDNRLEIKVFGEIFVEN